MTARQPPGEKGAKACTIGCDLSRDGFFAPIFRESYENWNPGKPEQPQSVSGHVPSNVTDRAITLRDQADRSGVLQTLWQLGIHEALTPYSPRSDDLSIDEMNLTVRSSNGLKRANAGTFGRLRDLLAMENGILSVRNLGQKSAKEIKQLFFEEC